MSNVKYTEAMSSFLREHYLLPAPELAQRFNAEFGTSRTSKQIHGARKARGLKTGRTGKFYKGQPAIKGSGSKGPNSTSFKKGARPSNTVKVGTEVVTAKDGYIKVKVAEPNVWEFKHRMVWEKKHGKIPDGYIISFEDLDRTNCNIDNLSLIPRSLLVRYNKLQVNDYDADTRPTIKLIAKINHVSSEITKSAA